MSDNDITKEQIDSLRELAETLTGKKFGNIKDPMKLQGYIDIARADKEEAEEGAPTVLTTSMKARQRQAARQKATKLVRVNITAFAPFEKQLKGAYFDVGNSVVGNIRRFIPFDTDWHVEAMMIDHIKDRKYRTKKEWKDPITRKPMYENIFHRAFGVMVLDDLTKEEHAEHVRAMKAREYSVG